MAVLLVGEQTKENAMRAAAMHTRGWSVDVVSPAALFARIAGRHPTAVVIDQGKRPPADAFALALRTRTDSSLPVVVLSSLRMPELAHSARSAGCIGISIPCPASSVLASVTSAVAMAGGAAWKTLTKSEGEAGTRHKARS